VHSYAPRQPFRVGQACGRAVAYLPDVHTLASHTTAGKEEPIQPPGTAQDRLHDAVVPTQGDGQHHPDRVQITGRVLSGTYGTDGANLRFV
jgi:hypothetical protein